MAKIKGICRNEDCEMCDQIQEAEKSNFKCEKCGKDLIPFGNKTSESSGGPNKKLIAILVGVIVLLAIIGGIIAMSGSGEETPKQEPVTVAPVDSDSIKAAQEAAEQQRIKDSLDAVAAAEAAKKQEAEKKTEPAPAAQKPAKSASGSKNLGYATFKGSWPNDVNGRMVFTSSHVIDSKDPKKRVAEAGDYVIGEWADGHLVQGIWYGSDNQVKGSVIIGR
jgi:hypothetical protein